MSALAVRAQLGTALVKGGAGRSLIEHAGENSRKAPFADIPSKLFQHPSDNDGYVRRF